MASLAQLKRGQESQNLSSPSQNGSFSTSQEIFRRIEEPSSGNYPPIGRAPFPPSFDAQPYPGHPGAFHNGAIYAQSAAQLGRSKRVSPSDHDGVADGPDAGKPPAKKPRTRRKKPTASIPVAEGAAGDIGTPTSPASTAAAAVAAVARYPPYGTQEAAAVDIEELLKRSREVTAATRKAKEPQVRKPWLREDIKTLIKAVDTYKCKWSAIEKAIETGALHFERPRDQQALRDKARLLKQDFLK